MNKKYYFVRLGIIPALYAIALMTISANGLTLLTYPFWVVLIAINYLERASSEVRYG